MGTLNDKQKAINIFEHHWGKFNEEQNQTAKGKLIDMSKVRIKLIELFNKYIM